MLLRLLQSVLRRLTSATHLPKRRASKTTLPIEELEHVFLCLKREDIEALQLSHRYFCNIVSTERFGKLTPLRPLGIVYLRSADVVIVPRNGGSKCFAYDSDDVVRWLRNICVDRLEMRTIFVRLERVERALRWYVAHRTMLRVIDISLQLPVVSAELQEAFLQPDPSHHWTFARIGGTLRGTLRLTSSSLENVEHLSIVSNVELQVTVDDVVRWLLRPVLPFIGTSCRELSMAFGNIDGELQRLLEAIREEFISATKSADFQVTIGYVPEDFLLANAHIAFRKYNRDGGDLLSVEVQTLRFLGPVRRNRIVIRRLPFS